MHKYYSRMTTIAIAMLLITSLLFAQDSYKLEYKYQKGNIHRFKHVSTSNITQEMMGKEMKMTNVSDMTVRVEIENVDKDGATAIIISFDSAKNMIKSPMMDSTMILDKLIGKKTRIILSKLGNILKREVIDTVKDEGMMGGAGQRSTTKIAEFPEKAIKFGDKWKSTDVDTIESMGGKIIHTTDMEYTLIGKEKQQEHDCLKIDYIGTTSDTGKMMMGGMELFVEGSGKVKGTMYFDLKLGLTVLDDSSIENEQTMAVTGQQNMTIPMSVSTKSARTLLENNK